MADPVPVRVPHETVNDSAVVVVSWLVTDGDVVHSDQPLAEVETSKAVIEILSPGEGVVRIMVPAGAELPVGDVLCCIGESRAAIDGFLSAHPPPPTASAASSAATSPEAALPPEAAPPTPSSLPVPRSSRFSRRAGELLRSEGLNESEFVGRGLVRAKDVQARGRAAAPLAPTSRESEMPTTDCAPPVSARAAVRSENLSHAKRLEARLLSWGLRDALRSSVVVAVPRKLEQSTRPDDAGDSERLSATIIFECARLLRKYPYLNGFCSGAQAQLYEPVNIGYALDAGRGLKVPVFRDADTKSLTVLVEDRRQLLVEYLNDELRPESMSAGTFTITDLSGEGVYTFEPLIVEGQSAILGVGGEFPAPRRGDTVYNLILAFDHRMVDGRMAASFLNDLSQRLQAHDGSGPAVDGSGEPRPQLRCAQCYVTGPEIRAARGFLVQVADSSSDEPSFVCTTCLQGW